MKDLPPLRIRGECLIKPDDQILYALAPEMAEALHECVKALDFGIMVMEGEGASTDQAQSALDEARAILARLPQKGGEK